jgi:hypothetical protein
MRAKKDEMAEDRRTWRILDTWRQTWCPETQMFYLQALVLEDEYNKRDAPGSSRYIAAQCESESVETKD